MLRWGELRTQARDQQTLNNRPMLGLTTPRFTTAHKKCTQKRIKTYLTSREWGYFYESQVAVFLSFAAWEGLPHGALSAPAKGPSSFAALDHLGGGHIPVGLKEKQKACFLSWSLGILTIALGDVPGSLSWSDLSLDEPWYRVPVKPTECSELVTKPEPSKQPSTSTSRRMMMCGMA